MKLLKNIFASLFGHNYEIEIDPGGGRTWEEAEDEVEPIGWLHLKIGDDMLPATEAYKQIDHFFRQMINLSTRPNSKGPYRLVVEAAWRESERTDHRKWDFIYEKREGIYTQLVEHMAEWEPAPRVIKAGILPYRALGQEL